MPFSILAKLPLSGINAACVPFVLCLPLMHWQKEHNFEALSPENQVQPTNKGREEEEEIHVGTNHAFTVILQSSTKTKPKA